MQPTITPTTNGPYRVEGLERLRNSRDEELAVRETLYLCRCGGSQNKPFCDGTHAKIGFRGRRESRRQLSRRRAYAGREVTILDNRAICAHAGFCTSELRAVFKSGRKPWITPDEAGVEAIAATISKCPSGALAYEIDGVVFGDQERAPTITVSKDGPYYVTGGVELLHPTGLHGPSREHFTLCRCGQSKNKPFCDGTHWYVGFRDPRN
jgi:CDGSH-type Zn-finger protein